MRARASSRTYHRTPPPDLTGVSWLQCDVRGAAAIDEMVATPMPVMREFYDAFSPRLEEAIDYCDKFPLDDLPDDALHLLHLIYSMIMCRWPSRCSTEANRRRRRRHRSNRGAGAMSVLTITKLTESVGAEVTGLDPERLT